MEEERIFVGFGDDVTKSKQVNKARTTQCLWSGSIWEKLEYHLRTVTSANKDFTFVKKNNLLNGTVCFVDENLGTSWMKTFDKWERYS